MKEKRFSDEKKMMEFCLASLNIFLCGKKTNRFFHECFTGVVDCVTLIHQLVVCGNSNSV